MEQTIQKYFNGYLKKGLFLMVISIALMSTALSLPYKHPVFSPIISGILFLVGFYVAFISVDLIAFYATKTIKWKNLDDFLDEIADTPIGFKGYTYSPLVKKKNLKKYCDLKIEVSGVKINIDKMPIEKTKEIQSAAEKSQNKLFKMFMRYGPTKGEVLYSELIIETIANKPVEPTLYASSSRLGIRAREILRDAGVSFIDIIEDDDMAPGTPRLIVDGVNSAYSGLREIRSYCESLKS